ncbi:MAG TPA: MarR family transcriptional regulator [Candidatus Saccharimonadales bacterium]|nr:MarR family transcriptional regulator [Candidatus Saccharimonadales bacterium]
MNRAEKIQEIIENVARLQRALSPIVWQKTQLSRAQLGMLYTLFYRPGINMKQLADHLGISKSAVTQLIEQLIDKGLVSRAPDTADRRVAVIALTTRGRQLVIKLNRYKMGGLRSAMSALSDHELKVLHELHQKLADAANQESQE